MDYDHRMRSMLDMLRRQVADSAAAHAMSRFGPDMGEHAELAHKIATIAAQTALDQFSAYCAAELRVIELDEERRRRDVMLRAPSMGPI